MHFEDEREPDLEPGQGHDNLGMDLCGEVGEVGEEAGEAGEESWMQRKKKRGHRESILELDL